MVSPLTWTAQKISALLSVVEQAAPDVPTTGIVSVLIRTIQYRSGNPRVETFPGAACYVTLRGATIFRAVVSTVGPPSKAAPPPVSLREALRAWPPDSTAKPHPINIESRWPHQGGRSNDRFCR